MPCQRLRIHDTRSGSLSSAKWRRGYGVRRRNKNETPSHPAHSCELADPHQSSRRCLAFSKNSSTAFTSPFSSASRNSCRCSMNTPCTRPRFSGWRWRCPPPHLRRTGRHARRVAKTVRAHRRLFRRMRRAEDVIRQFRGHHVRQMARTAHEIVMHGCAPASTRPPSAFKNSSNFSTVSLLEFGVGVTMQTRRALEQIRLPARRGHAGFFSAAGHGMAAHEMRVCPGNQGFRVLDVTLPFTLPTSVTMAPGLSDTAAFSIPRLAHLAERRAKNH